MESNTTLYIIKRNDSLESIAKEHNIEVSEIIRLNPLAKYRIFEGQPLILNSNKDNKKELRNDIKPSKIDAELLSYKSFRYFIQSLFSLKVQSKLLVFLKTKISFKKLIKSSIKRSKFFPVLSIFSKNETIEETSLLWT